MSKPAFNAVIYFISSSFAALLAFLLLPVFTHNLDAEALGKYSLFQMTMSIGIPLVSLALNSTIGRQFAELEKGALVNYFSSCFWLGCLAFFVTLFLSAVFQSWIFALVGLEAKWIALALVCAFTQGLLAVMMTMNTIQKRPFQYALWRIGSALSLGLAVIAVIYGMHGGWQEVVWSQAAISLVLIALLVIAMWRKQWLTLHMNRRDTRHALDYSLPLVVHTIASLFAMQVMDRLFVKHYLGVQGVGIYHVAQQASMAMWLFVNAINLAWTPWYYEKSLEGTHEAHFTIVRASYKLFAAMCAGAALCIAALWIIFPYLIGEQFMQARSIMPILVIGYVFNGMYMITSTALFHHGKTLWIAFTTIAVAFLSLGFNAAFVPIYGLWGAAASTMLSMVCLFLIVWVIVIRHYNLPWFRRSATRAPQAMDN